MAEGAWEGTAKTGSAYNRWADPARKRPAGNCESAKGRESANRTGAERASPREVRRLSPRISRFRVFSRFRSSPSEPAALCGKPSGYARYPFSPPFAFSQFLRDASRIAEVQEQD